MSDYDGEEIFLPELVERWPRQEALAWHRGYWADGEGDRVRFVLRRNAGLSREDCALQLLATAMPGACSKGKLAGLLREWDDVEEQWVTI
jgi:hypothetical protein